jgi:hypothetical protein
MVDWTSVITYEMGLWSLDVQPGEFSKHRKKKKKKKSPVAAYLYAQSNK